MFGAAFPTEGDMAQIMRQRIHPDDQTAFAAFEDVLAAGQPADIECRVIGFDNVTRWIWIRAVARREEGRLFVDGISTNVTERRELIDRRERLLADEQRQVQRLRELDRMKDDLVALASHELRNPIAAIRSHVELLLDDEQVTGDHRHLTTVIDRHSAHLAHLGDDLLDLARLDSGHLTLDVRPLSLTRIAEQTIADHRSAADAKHLSLTARLPRHLPADADPVRLRQVLDNLLSNAIRYTPAGGVVTVTGRHDGTSSTIAVTDTGIGVPADEYPALLAGQHRDRTRHQGHRTRPGHHQGIVDAHRGSITAAPGRTGGTVVTVSLPAPQPPERRGSRR